MFRLSPNHFLAVAIAALAIFSSQAAAQPNPLPPARPGKLPLLAVVTNGNVNFSWPLMPGRWDLFEQPPGAVGEWKPVPRETYHTNEMIVSTSRPQPKQATLYRVKRTLALAVPALPNFPPIPPPPTNRPPPRPPGRP
jgi:hypothetical protein